jgi:hypothetical protein
MDRRESLKALIIGSVSTAVLADACKPSDKTRGKLENSESVSREADRMVEEKISDREIKEKKFFNSSEMLTITLLGDIIIPKDKISGSASDAKVPEFIEFIVNDMPEHQVPMRGGIGWLNFQCLKRFKKDFNACTPDQRMVMVDEIAWPEKAKPEMKPGVAFFSLMRNLTATGFYTSEMGVNDIGYVGNRPNLWNGVPDDVLKQYNLAYTEKELKECISYDLKTS